jgi:cytoskeleton protein RodZ
MTDSVGARLRQARELRRLTLEQASETTKVRLHYLQALENDDYSAIPSAAQARGFLRLYAELLGLDVSELTPAALLSLPPAEVPVTGAILPAQAPRGLWAGLRQRFKRGADQPVVPAAEPTAEAATLAQPGEQAVPLPATTDIKTKESRKAKEASVDGAAGDVKKNDKN